MDYTPVGLSEAVPLLEVTHAPPLPVLPKELMSGIVESGAELDNEDTARKTTYTCSYDIYTKMYCIQVLMKTTDYNL